MNNEKISPARFAEQIELLASGGAMAILAPPADEHPCGTTAISYGKLI
jgi:hypothetical protein